MKRNVIIYHVICQYIYAREMKIWKCICNMICKRKYIKYLAKAYALSNVIEERNNECVWREKKKREVWKNREKREKREREEKK